MTTFNIHAAGSQVNWTGKKVLGLHTGTITIARGFVQMQDQQLKQAEVVMDMRTIVITDIDDSKTNQSLKEHLFNQDFFAVEQFPEAILKITSAEQVRGNDYTLKGELTIKSITHPVHFNVHMEVLHQMLHAKGEIIVDRTLYNIRYGSGKFFQNLGDTLIHDEFVLKFNLIANQHNNLTI